MPIVPVGTIVAYALEMDNLTAEEREEWQLCDGRPVHRNTHLSHFMKKTPDLRLRDSCRLQVVASNSFLHANDLGDHSVGTSDNIDDNYTWFRLIQSPGNDYFQIQVVASNRFLHEGRRRCSSQAT